MDSFLQITGAVLLTVIVCICLDGQARLFASMLVMLVCALVLISGMRYLRQILQFLKSLSEMTGLEEVILTPLFKSLGIGILSEITVRICTDAGFGSLGKAIQFVTNGLIVCISLPVFQALIELLQKMMEAI